MIESLKDIWHHMFIHEKNDMILAYASEYNLFLVALSVLIAAIAAYAALQISERLSQTERRIHRILWLLFGALAMGCGIWTMHFIGMIAFSIPVPVYYEPKLTFFSILPGILASGIAIHFMNRKEISFLRLNCGGLLMGLGIGAMHYSGMAAMRSSAMMKFDLWLFILSIAVAHFLATLSLYVNFIVKKKGHFADNWFLIISALIMGCAVAGMHYTGMAAAFYFPGESFTPGNDLLDTTMLAYVVVLLTATILSAAIIASIVERKLSKTSQALASSERRAYAILSSVHEGIVGTDENGVIIFANPAALKILEMKEVYELNISTIKLIQMDHEEELIKDHTAIVEEVIRKGELFQSLDIALLDSNSQKRSIDFSCSPIFENEKVVGTVIIFSDISERKNAEELKASFERQIYQSQKMESIGVMAAGIAHEINTPIQYVGDNTRFLQESFEQLSELHKEILELDIETLKEKTESCDLEYLNDEIPQAIDQSLQGITAVANIVKAMKEFSHPGAKEMTPVDIHHALDTTLVVSKNEWKYFAEIEKDYDESLPLVSCLPNEMNQVFLNLIVNAAHAIKEKMENEKLEEKGLIKIRTRSKEENILIEIEDSGVGISEENQSKVFDHFFTTKEVGVGTGQGLSMAHSVLVDQHRGAIRLESSLGKGTKFIIELPVQA